MTCDNCRMVSMSPRRMSPLRIPANPINVSDHENLSFSEQAPRAQF